MEAYDPTTDVWTDRASATRRYGHGLATASNGKLYAVGGFDNAGTIVATVEEYNPATDTWTTKSPMSEPRAFLALAAASNGKLYAVGGDDGSGQVATVEEYDPATDTWTTKAPMSGPRSELALAAASNGKLYAVGGTNGSFVATVEEYDPATDGWTTKAPMAGPRLAPGLAAASNGRLYVVGGYDGSVFLATAEEYDPATDVWTPKASMTTPHYALGLAAASNGRLYAVGGVNNGGNVFASVEEYNPATDTWAPKNDLATARRHFGLASFTAPPTVAYYRFEEGPADAVASEIVDSSGNGLHGTVIGGPAYRTDKFGSTVPKTGAANSFSMNFSSSAAASFDYAFPFNTQTNATVEFWINPEVGGGGEWDYLWKTNTPGDANRFNFRWDNDQVCLDYRDPDTTLHDFGCTPADSVPAGEWTYVAIVKEGNTYSFYINGSATANLTNLSHSFTDSSPNLPTNTSWTISGRGIEAAYGKLDELRLSNAALDPSEFLVAGPETLFATTTTVESSGTPTVFGKSVTFTATVSPTPPASGNRPAR